MSTSGKRGKYTSRACNHCRRRKKRCDGAHPVCGPCHMTGHDCQWGPDNARKANTKRYVDSLRNMNQLLERRIRELEAQVASSGSTDNQFLNSYPLQSEDISPMGSHCSSPRSDETLVKREDSEDPEVAQLAGRSYHLHLEDDDLHMYGPTSILRLAPRGSPPSSPMNDLHDLDSGTYHLGVRLDIAWDRYLPSDVPLSQNEHDRLMDLLFRYYTSWCLRVIPELFLRDMYRVLNTPVTQSTGRTTHYSPMLHNALLAVATAFSDNPAIKDPISRKRYAEKAKEFLEIECERPRLSTVVALSMMASYHSSEGTPTLGYMYFGISARMAQALGLSLDSKPWATAGYISGSNMRDRNWTYWVTFCQDTTWSLYMGRDFCINSSSGSQKIPAPFTEDDQEPAPWNWPPGQSGYGNNILQTFPATCELLSIGREIMEVVSNFSQLDTRQDADDFVIGQMDLKLNTWKNNLSADVDVTKSNIPAASPHQLMLQMTYHWLVIVLHRPFYRHSPAKDKVSFEIDHVKVRFLNLSDVSPI
ncbi:fungal-specific transcription factor domain-containing protein [Amylostereum chailletii]|nr:fungal-specific transcription factor domain-containing protein [Amylostereum chailletii]